MWNLWMCQLWQVWFVWCEHDRTHEQMGHRFIFCFAPHNLGFRPCRPWRVPSVASDWEHDHTVNHTFHCFSILIRRGLNLWFYVPFFTVLFSQDRTPNRNRWSMSGTHQVQGRLWTRWVRKISRWVTRVRCPKPLVNWSGDEVLSKAAAFGEDDHGGEPVAVADGCWVKMPTQSRFGWFQDVSSISYQFSKIVTLDALPSWLLVFE